MKFDSIIITNINCLVEIEWKLNYFYEIIYKNALIFPSKELKRWIVDHVSVCKYIALLFGGPSISESNISKTFKTNPNTTHLIPIKQIMAYPIRI